ncbi:unnamed protein product [Victoria cruziana]
MAKELAWDGTLSPHEFQEAAMAFVEKWKGCRPLPVWTWKPFTRLPYTLTHDEGGYLSLESVYKHVPEEIYSNMDGYSLENSTLAEVADAATLVWDCGKEAHVYDFHIIYSASYRVPVLYFRGYSIGGQPLHWSVIKEDLPLSSIKMLDESRWTFITQEFRIKVPQLRPEKIYGRGTGKFRKLFLKMGI